MSCASDPAPLCSARRCHAGVALTPAARVSEAELFHCLRVGALLELRTRLAPFPHHLSPPSARPFAGQMPIHRGNVLRRFRVRTLNPQTFASPKDTTTAPA